MKKLVLFLKTYLGDLERAKIFKKSVDLHNIDNIPLFIIVPESDLQVFEKECRTHNEKYDLYVISDEDVLRANNIPYSGQNWKNQQLVKLGFYKLNYCENYAIFDSDCYFIAPFYSHDFLLGEKIPYLCIKEETGEELKITQAYFHRTGRCYSFIHPGQVFNKDVLQDMEKNLLKKQNWTFSDLIQLSPYEFQWYGEYFLKTRKLPFIYTKGITKVFWYEEDYQSSKKNGLILDDFIQQGFKCLCIQNRWCHHLTYKPHPLYRLIKWKNNLSKKWNHPKIYKKNIIKHLIQFIKKMRKI